MRKIFALVALIVISAFLLGGVVEMRGDDGGFGEPVNTEMDDFFLEDSQEHNQVNNVVTAVLFDYRGLDTLGEATVLFSAVSGVLTVLRKYKSSKEEELTVLSKSSKEEKQ
ncbi:MAG: hydrogen gas-evolving membrane-bound hydrogenase subunit E [Candidatus Saliniplasma sp.]